MSDNTVSLLSTLINSVCLLWVNTHLDTHICVCLYMESSAHFHCSCNFETQGVDPSISSAKLWNILFGCFAISSNLICFCRSELVHNCGKKFCFELTVSNWQYRSLNFKFKFQSLLSVWALALDKNWIKFCKLTRIRSHSISKNFHFYWTKWSMHDMERSTVHCTQFVPMDFGMLEFVLWNACKCFIRAKLRNFWLRVIWQQ